MKVENTRELYLRNQGILKKISVYFLLFSQFPFPLLIRLVDILANVSTLLSAIEMLCFLSDEDAGETEMLFRCIVHSK